MKPYILDYGFGDNSPKATLFYGRSVLDSLKALDPGIIQTVATSPPYWGLRDYKTEPVLWGADPSCDHEWGDVLPRGNRGISGQGGRQTPGLDEALEGGGAGDSGVFCQKCGAWRGQLGLEPVHDCGHASSQEITYVLREDLSDADRAFVLAELTRRGLL